MNEFVAHRFGSHESERKPTLEEAKAVEGTNLVLEVNPEGKNMGEDEGRVGRGGL